MGGGGAGAQSQPHARLDEFHGTGSRKAFGGFGGIGHGWTGHGGSGATGRLCAAHKGFRRERQMSVLQCNSYLPGGEQTT